MMRILTTVQKDDDQGEDEDAGKKGMHLYSKNYKRFLENR
jgi:hypothetical protein